MVTMLLTERKLLEHHRGLLEVQRWTFSKTEWRDGEELGACFHSCFRLPEWTWNFWSCGPVNPPLLVKPS